MFSTTNVNGGRWGSGEREGQGNGIGMKIKKIVLKNLKKIKNKKILMTKKIKEKIPFSYYG